MSRSDGCGGRYDSCCFSSRRRHTRCALVTGVQTCALPIFLWRRWREGPIELEDYPWGTFSAGLLTHAIKRNRLMVHAQPPDVFYPVRYKDALALYEPARRVNAMLTPRTIEIGRAHV